MEDVYKKKGGAGSYQQRKRKDCFRQGHLPLGGRTVCLMHADSLIFLWAGGDGEVVIQEMVKVKSESDDLIDADQKIQTDWLKTLFLERLKLQ